MLQKLNMVKLSNTVHFVISKIIFTKINDDNDVTFNLYRTFHGI